MYKNELKKEAEVINSVSINDNLREVLKSIFVQNLSPYDNREQHLLFSYQKVVSELPPTVLSSIRDFKCRADASPVLLIRNLPTDDDLPETPHDAKRSLRKKSFISESCLTGFSQLLGDVYGYVNEKKGELIHNVCPVQSQEAKNFVSESSIKILPFHVEYGYFDFRPDYLSLYCLRSDRDQHAATTIVYVRDLINNLSSKETEILRKPLFSFPYFEKINDEILWSRPCPILSGPISNADLVLHLPEPEMKPLTKEAEEVFKILKEKIVDSNIPSYSVRLEPGDLLFINNRRVAHGRSEFTPRYDGNDRWLQRVYVTKNLWDGRSEGQEDFRIVIGKKASDVENLNKELELMIEVPPK